jgi:hypothetical protein
LWLRKIMGGRREKDELDYAAEAYLKGRQALGQLVASSTWMGTSENQDPVTENVHAAIDSRRSRRNVRRNKVAMSQIVSSIILVSIVIVIATTSSYWMEALASSHMTFEQIDLPTAYAEYDSSLFSNGGWNITVEIKNSGSADAAIKNIFLNTLPISGYSAGSIALYVNDKRYTDLSSISISLAKASSVRILLQVERYQGGIGIQGCTSMTTIDLKFHTSAGIVCPLRIWLT